MKRVIFLFLLIIYHSSGYSWNATGHQLVAQIAYDNLSPQAKKMCSQILQVQENDLEPYFVNASTWLDEIRKKNIHQLDSLHYIDIPFTKDKSPLPAINSKNALWGIKEAILVLSSNKTTNAIQLLSLKILIHVIGDIHQPLHTTTKVSRYFPKGDMGGNLYLFSRSAYGKNLHQYWDNGAGMLKKSTLKDIKKQAQQWEHSNPCYLISKLKTPQQWIEKTHFIAINQVYSLRTHKKPNKNYQYNAREITAQQISLAGCRLAEVLNRIAIDRSAQE